MKQYFEEFKFCPKCGTKYDEKDKPQRMAKVFRCRQCSMAFYQNSKPSTAAIITQQDHPENIIITKRSIDPGKGLYDLPGGFCEYHENPEKGIVREVREEIGIKVIVKKLFDIGTVYYDFKNVKHSVVTIYFITQPISIKTRFKQNKEIDTITFRNVNEVMKDERKFIFPADRAALKKYINYINQ